jgi:hypothetical protein
MRRVVVLWLFIAGCVTPSIPIPPPNPAKMSFHLTGTGSAGTATFSYTADDRYVDSVAYVYNTDLGVGVIQNANADGSIGPTQPFPAIVGTRVEVTIQLKDQTESTCVRVREGAPDPFDPC